MSPEQCARLSQQVVSRFLLGCGLGAESWKAKRVGLYSAMPGELCLLPLAEKLETWGALLAYPRVNNPQAAFDGVMEFAECSTDPSYLDWEKGPWGILQPGKEARSLLPEELDFVFVPGMAFGPAGERVGRGKGFYDRWMVGAPNVRRVALVFDFQVFSKLEQAHWDQKVDEVWTESRTFRKLA